MAHRIQLVLVLWLFVLAGARPSLWITESSDTKVDVLSDTRRILASSLQAESAPSLVKPTMHGFTTESFEDLTTSSNMSTLSPLKKSVGSLSPGLFMASVGFGVIMTVFITVTLFYCFCTYRGASP